MRRSTTASPAPAIPAPFSSLPGLPTAVEDHESTRGAVAAGTAPRAAAPGGPAPRRGPGGRTRPLLPGLAATAAAVFISWLVNRLVPAFSPLTCAVLLGAIVANLGLLPRGARPGLGFAGKRLMRAGIVLLGLKLALSDVFALGWETLAVTAAVVTLTFLGTNWLGRRMGLPGDQPLLVATGFSICGASAVAAMNSVTDSDDDDVATAVALVTLCGTLAIILLPLLHHPLGLTDLQFGRWVGASVHDVGQVVATAQTAGPNALDQAVVVKMMRIAMLAPLVAAVAMNWRRRATRAVAGPGAKTVGTNVAAGTVIAKTATARPAGSAGATAKRPPIVPLFVLGFLAMVAVRSTGVLPLGAVNVSQDLANLLMAAGLFALGTGVDVAKLARTGGRAVALGLTSWLLIATVAYVGVRLTTH